MTGKSYNTRGISSRYLIARIVVVNERYADDKSMGINLAYLIIQRVLICPEMNKGLSQGTRSPRKIKFSRFLVHMATVKGDVCSTKSHGRSNLPQARNSRRLLSLAIFNQSTHGQLALPWGLIIGLRPAYSGR